MQSIHRRPRTAYSTSNASKQTVMLLILIMIQLTIETWEVVGETSEDSGRLPITYQDSLARRIRDIRVIRG